METSIGAAMRSAQRNWGWMLAYGIMLVLLGIFAMMHPVATGLAVGIILAICFLAGGVGALIAVFRDAGWQAKFVDILFAILGLVAGFLCISNPFNGATSLVWAIGLMFLVIGVIELAAAFRASGEKIWLFVLGIIDVLIGVYAVFMMGPAAALVTLSVLVGIAFVFRGLMLSSIAWRLRGMATR